MNIFSFITGIIKPVTTLIDNLHTSDAERMQLQNEINKVIYQLQEKVLSYETRMMESQASIIAAEAKGSSWMQRNWRPIIMFMFGFIIAWNYIISPMFGLLVLPLPDQIWTLIQIGLGGYIGGRSLEKIVPGIAKIITESKRK